MNGLRLEDIELANNERIRFQLSSSQIVQVVTADLEAKGCTDISMVLSQGKIRGRYKRSSIVLDTESGATFTVNRKKPKKESFKGLQAALRYILSDGQPHLVTEMHERLKTETFDQLLWGKPGSRNYGTMAPRTFIGVPREKVIFTLRHNMSDAEQIANTKWQQK